MICNACSGILLCALWLAHPHQQVNAVPSQPDHLHPPLTQIAVQMRVSWFSPDEQDDGQGVKDGHGGAWNLRRDEQLMKLDEQNM